MALPSPAQVQAVAAQLTQLTLDECAAAIGATALSPRLRQIAVSPFLPFARRLGAQIAQFDADTSVSLTHGAAALLTRLHVPLRSEFSAPLPAQGPLLVISNHPGAYDALLLFATLQRPDLRLIAAERSFLRSLPNVSRHFVYVPDAPTKPDAKTPLNEQTRLSETQIVGQPNAPQPNGKHSTPDINGVNNALPSAPILGSRGRGLREVVRHLKDGGAVLHFAAGQIEPDPAFSTREKCLEAWPSGAAALANTCLRLGGHVVLALVSGVHSPRVKHSALIRFAEARGITTLSTLIQIALPRLFTVSALVRFSAPLARDSSEGITTAQLQHALRQLY